MATATAAWSDKDASIELLSGHPLADAVLSNHYIHVTTSGTVPVDYDVSMNVLMQDDILTLVQSTYEEILEKGETAEFVIKQVDTNQYRFVNSEGETADIYEVYRRLHHNGAFDLVYFAEGDRSFGHFKSLTHITIRDMYNGSSHYYVNVFAYPENGVTRFFARHLRIVSRFFKRQTASIADVSTRVVLALHKQMEG